MCHICSGSMKSSVSNRVARRYIYIMSHRLISKLVYKFNKVLWAPCRWNVREWRSWDQESVVEWIPLVSIKQRPEDWTRKHKRAGTLVDSGDCLMHHPHLPQTDLCGSRSEPFCREPAAASNAAYQACSSLARLQVQRLAPRGWIIHLGEPRLYAAKLIFSSTCVSEKKKINPLQSMRFRFPPRENFNPASPPTLLSADRQNSTARAGMAERQRVNRIQCFPFLTAFCATLNIIGTGHQTALLSWTCGKRSV